MGNFTRVVLRSFAVGVAVCALSWARPAPAQAAITFSAPQRVTNTPGVVEEPVGWHPWGYKILFLARQAGVSQGIGIASTDTGTRTIVRSGDFQAACYSHDGQWISASTLHPGVSGTLWMMRNDGTSFKQVTSVFGPSMFVAGDWLWTGSTYPGYVDDQSVKFAYGDGTITYSLPGAYSPPRVSSSSAKVGYTDYARRAMLGSVADQGPNPQTTLTNRTGWIADGGMAWSPDGSQLTWVERQIAEPGSQPMRIWVANSSGDQYCAAEFPSDMIAEVQTPQISYDGKYLAFWGIERLTGAARLWVMSATGGEPVALEDVDYAANVKPWHPYQDKLAFLAGDGDIYTVQVSGDPQAAPAAATLNTPEPNEYGWTAAGSQVEVIAPEGRPAFYQWDSVDTEGWRAAAGPLSIPEGEHTLNYCLDAPGSVVTMRTKAFKVDATAPTFEGEAWPQVSDYRISIVGNPMVHDWESGLLGVELWEGENMVASAPALPLEIVGYERRNYDLRVVAVDRAGNRSAGYPISLPLPPVPHASAVVQGEPNENGWYGAPPLVEIVPDPEVGEHGAPRFYRWDGQGEWSWYSSPIVAWAEGEHRLEYYQADEWQGDHQVKTLDLKVDCTPPAAPALIGTAINTNYLQFNVAAQDETSGVSYYEYTDYEGRFTTSTASFVEYGGLEPDTDYTISVRAVDLAGNRSESASFTLHTGATPPAPDPDDIPSGTDVRVSVGNVSLQFPTVIGPGEASVIALDPRQSPAAGHRIVPGLYFDIHPTATFSGEATVTISVAQETEVDFGRLKLMHWAGGGWQDITISRDPAGRTISGRTSSFSDFAVQESDAPDEEQPAPPVVSTPASSWWSVLVAVAGAVIVVRRRRTS